MNLERLAGIASAEVGVEDHLLVLEMGIKVARPLKIGRRCPKLAQQRELPPVLDGRRNRVSPKSPHLNTLRRPQHCEDAATSSIQSRTRKLIR